MSSFKLTKVHMLLSKHDLAAAATFLRKNAPESCKVVELLASDGADLAKQYGGQLAEAEVLLTSTPLLADVLESVPRLRWAQVTFAGVEKLMNRLPPGQGAPPFTVTRLADETSARELAEWVLTAVLTHARRFHFLYREQRHRRWAHHDYTYRPMGELTIGVLGTGQMGQQVGLLFKQLGCTVHGLSRTGKSPNESFDRMFTGEQLAAFLQSADYLCNLLPSTAGTRGLLTPALLSALPRRPVLVNAGRGDLVSEPLLVQALQEGWLSGAVLDVFETEPLPDNSPLWDMEQVVISPHVGNLVRMENVNSVFLENLGRYQRGEPLLYPVNFAVGY